MSKRTCFLTFAFFFLAIIAILLPFGVIISYKIGVKTGIISKNSSLASILASFSSIFSKNTSNNTYLSENVVFLQCLKGSQNRHLPKLLQQLTLKLLPKKCIKHLTVSACILLINMAPNMQYHNQ